jgi:hypothetical protein
MNDIAYVVLSDLHFGASNSLLSALVAGDADQVRPVDPQSPSPVLTAFLDSIPVLVKNRQGSRPTLILAGGVLDLALSTDDVAAMVFNQFARRAFGETPLFADNVIFVPGNHDHHLWETARKSQYTAYMRSLPSPDTPIKPGCHTTRMRADADAQPVESSIIEALIFKQTGREVTVRVVYPNLALNDRTGQRCVVIHHGHFTESIYLLMSQLKEVVFPEQRPTTGLPQVWEWEAENFAWIDFFWSALGRSGGVGADVGLVYAQLRSPPCLKHDRRGSPTT